MQVGLVPYTLSEFNRASFPLKTLEYLAAGLPVVSTNLPATRWLDTPLATIADDHATFVAAVRAAATIPSSADERQRFAAAHSWESRAADYLKLVTTASMP
jgi:teichuronic acid biosynthesis glycosyltransferase TuaH